uniref:Uncharacterized protein n=1 Tax=Physcomitrium patens TaxID=3218 RepID=A0A2K1JZD5_PHYPA|nr:hypothetical protein PHYPA_014009 [Physcomitrium patens]
MTECKDDVPVLNAGGSDELRRAHEVFFMIVCPHVKKNMVLFVVRWVLCALTLTVQRADVGLKRLALI